jgi:hypothetical protein
MPDICYDLLTSLNNNLVYKNIELKIPKNIFEDMAEDVVTRNR